MLGNAPNFTSVLHFNILHLLDGSSGALKGNKGGGLLHQREH